MRINTKLSVAVHCLLFLHEYGAAQRVTSGILALSTGCNPVVIRNLMSALKKAGIVESAAGRGGTKLCRPPEEITFYHILQAVDPDGLNNLIGVHPLPSALCPVGKSIRAVLAEPYQQIQEEVKNSLEARTLAEVVLEYQKKQRPE